MIKLIATDMDGTLLTSEKKFPPHMFNIIDQLHEREIKFAVASGRQYYTLLKDFESVKDEVTFMQVAGSTPVLDTSKGKQSAYKKKPLFLK